MSPICEIPVKMIGAWGSPIPVGVASIDDTRNMHIKFNDHELVNEFYDLRDQEMIVTISFQYAKAPAN
jgi:hypothetical protein